MGINQLRYPKKGKSLNIDMYFANGDTGRTDIIVSPNLFNNSNNQSNIVITPL